jgi:hypothetical protein
MRGYPVFKVLTLFLVTVRIICQHHKKILDVTINHLSSSIERWWWQRRRLA